MEIAAVLAHKEPLAADILRSSAARRWKRSRRCADLVRPQPSSRRPWAGQRRRGPRSTRPGAGAAAPCRPRRPAPRRSGGRRRTSGSAVGIAARAGARRRRAAAAGRPSCCHSRLAGAGPATPLTSLTRPRTGNRERSRTSVHADERTGSPGALVAVARPPLCWSRRRCRAAPAPRPAGAVMRLHSASLRVRDWALGSRPHSHGGASNR